MSGATGRPGLARRHGRGALLQGVLLPGVLFLCGLAAWPVTGRADPATQASFDCNRVRHGSMAQWVCEIPALAALDRELARVYSQARGQATGTAARQLAAEQRGWIRGRDDCWKSDDVERCLRDAYRRRTAELQVKHALVPPRRTLTLVCSRGPGQEAKFTLRYFDTDPPAAWIEPDPEQAVLFGEPVASGTLYRGRNTTLREHQGVIELQQGFQAPTLSCHADGPAR